MTSPELVVDASPLIILLKSGLADILPAMFDSIVVPDAVWTEIMAGAPDDLARQLLPDLHWLTRVAFMEVDEKVDALNLGRGEIETISLALTLENASVLLDDAAARGWAKSFGLSVVGTGGLLIKAKKRGLISSFANSLNDVKSAGLWISPQIESLLLLKAGESSSEN